MVQDRFILTLYTTAVCNLKCRYCYIDKNPALKNIDTILNESFKGDYYYNFARKIFPDPGQLKEVQLWGGEPSIRLDRAKYTVRKLIKTYYNLNTFVMSTNFTIDNFSDQFWGFIDVLKDFPDRKFTFNLQLSIDGPEWLNDYSRGKGVTKKFTKTFKHFMREVPERLPNNVTLNWHFKPTLDDFSIRLLQSKEKIIEYFQFFERYYKYADSCTAEMPNVMYGYAIPNTACPSPHTKESGKLFANYCKLTREIEEENESKHYFNFYKIITSFVPRNNRIYEHCSYENNGFMCGSGRIMVGLLPYNKISICHSGFVDLISDYKKLCMDNVNNKKNNQALDFKLFLETTTSRMCLSEEEFAKYEQAVDYFFKERPEEQFANMAALIRLLARTGQIDEKYKDEKEALKGAIFVQNATAYCVRDAIGSTGSMFMPPLGLPKLLLNGARDYIERGEI